MFWNFSLSIYPSINHLLLVDGRPMHFFPQPSLQALLGGLQGIPKPAESLLFVLGIHRLRQGLLLPGSLLNTLATLALVMDGPTPKFPDFPDRCKTCWRNWESPWSILSTLMASFTTYGFKDGHQDGHRQPCRHSSKQPPQQWRHRTSPTRTVSPAFTTMQLKHSLRWELKILLVGSSVKHSLKTLTKCWWSDQHLPPPSDLTQHQMVTSW